jgi:ATP/ADP translocase
MYGSRGSKATGSSINLYRKPLMLKFGPQEGLNMFITYCAYMSVGIIAVWFFVALYLGRTFKKAVDEQREIC